MAGKSVLVVDTPNTCKECKCQMMLVCVPADEDIDEYVNPSKTKPDWCPLKDLPQKIEGKREKFMPTYSLGWNDCLDAIELGLKPLWEITE